MNDYELEVVATTKSVVETDTEIFNVVDPLAGVRCTFTLTDWPEVRAKDNCCAPELDVVVKIDVIVAEQAPVASVHVPLHVDQVSVLPALTAVPVCVMLILLIAKSPVFFRVKKLDEVQTDTDVKAII